MIDQNAGYVADFNLWESHFLGRLIRSLGDFFSPRREGSGILKEEERTNFFSRLQSLGLYNNNVSCLSREGNGTPLSTLAWKIPWPEEPCRLQSMGLRRVGHDWATSLSLFTFIHWRRKWQSTPMFLPGESQGQGSLVGCCLWSLTESDTTEAI